MLYATKALDWVDWRKLLQGFTREYSRLLGYTQPVHPRFSLSENLSGVQDAGAFGVQWRQSIKIGASTPMTIL